MNHIRAGFPPLLIDDMGKRMNEVGTSRATGTPQEVVEAAFDIQLKESNRIPGWGAD